MTQETFNVLWDGIHAASIRDVSASRGPDSGAALPAVNIQLFPSPGRKKSVAVPLPLKNTVTDSPVPR